MKDLVLAENGKSLAIILVAQDAIAPERTAARELAAYLGKVTGTEFGIVTEGKQKSTPEAGQTLIAVGATHYARDMDINASLLGPEHWFMRRKANVLVLAGGRPRGTLYAVYHFLEDVVGVHWWSAWAEHVPDKPTLTIGPLDRHGEPVFAQRAMAYTAAFSQDPRSAARNRINFHYCWPIPSEYGGESKYGPPNFCHTFCFYLPPTDALFKQHPEWFLMDADGKRKRFDEVQENQLCLSNQAMREVFLAKLKDNINKSRNDPVPPIYFDVSPNDSPRFCQCEACQAVVKAKGGADAGLLLDFLNYLADHIQDEHPEIILGTLAYLNTEAVPRHIKARSNVAIRLCNTRSNYLEPIPANGPFARLLSGWAKIADKVMVWDYHSSFCDMAAPMPLEHTFQPDLQLFLRHNVVSTLNDYRYPMHDELFDFRMWVLVKLHEDPYQDVEPLIETFLNGFYGPAAPHLRGYLHTLEQASRAKPSAFNPGSTMAALRYLDLPFLRQAQALFVQAEAAVKDSPVLVQRVRHARMGVDKATVILFPKLYREWIEGGNKPDDIPFDREQIAERVRQTYDEQWSLRVDANDPGPSGREVREYQRRDFLDSITTALRRKLIIVARPKKFADLPDDACFQYAADAFGYTREGTEVVEVEEAESGIANRSVLTDAEIKAMTHPLRLDLHDHNRKATGHEPTIESIEMGDIAGSGYHWYQFGTYALGLTSFLWFYEPALQLNVNNACDPFDLGQTFDIWVHVKFEGPAFKHGLPDQANAILIERVVLVKKG